MTPEETDTIRTIGRTRPARGASGAAQRGYVPRVAGEVLLANLARES
jgi:hypothetical protein